MYFPDTYFVPCRQRDGESAPLGFPVPDGTDAAAKKRKDTALRWAGDYGGDNKNVIAFKNEPMDGFTFSRSVRRYGYFGSGNVVWRVVHPLGFEFEISSDNMAQFILGQGIVDGKILGKCLLARDGARNALVHESCPDYKHTLSNTAIKYAKAATIAGAKVLIGDTVLLQSKDTNTPVRYVGKVRGLKLVRDAGATNRGIIPNVLGVQTEALTTSVTRHLFVSTSASDTYHLIAEPKIVQHTSFVGSAAERETFRSDTLNRLNEFNRQENRAGLVITGTDTGEWWRVRNQRSLIVPHDVASSVQLDFVPIEVETASYIAEETMTMSQLDGQYIDLKAQIRHPPRDADLEDFYDKHELLRVKNTCLGLNVVGPWPKNSAVGLHFRKRGSNRWTLVMNRYEIVSAPAKRMSQRLGDVEFPLMTIAEPTWNKALLTQLATEFPPLGDTIKKLSFSDDPYIGVFTANYLNTVLGDTGERVTLCCDREMVSDSAITSLRGTSADLTPRGLGFGGAIIRDGDYYWHQPNMVTSAALSVYWPTYTDVVSYKPETSWAGASSSLSRPSRSSSTQVLGRCSELNIDTGEFSLRFNSDLTTEEAVNLVGTNIAELFDMLRDPSKYEFSVLAFRPS